MFAVTLNRRLARHSYRKIRDCTFVSISGDDPPLETKPSLAPPALLKNSTMRQSPTDGCQRTPQDCCHHVVLCSPDCMQTSVKLNKQRAWLRKNKTLARRHSSINTYKSAAIVSCSPRVVSAVNQRWCLRCFHTFPALALLTDSLIFPQLSLCQMPDNA